MTQSAPLAWRRPMTSPTIFTLTCATLCRLTEEKAITSSKWLEP
jgi:hypothetical protein